MRLENVRMIWKKKVKFKCKSFGEHKNVKIKIVIFRED